MHSAAYREFMTNTPNSAEHEAFMARAATLYPTLPPGAQQNALHCLETLGKGYARRYAANASARHHQNERALMGTTLSAWRAKRSDEGKPYRYEGVCYLSPKRAREEAERKARYAEYMAKGREIAQRKAARARKTAYPKFAAALASANRRPRAVSRLSIAA